MQRKILVIVLGILGFFIGIFNRDISCVISGVVVFIIGILCIYSNICKTGKVFDAIIFSRLVKTKANSKYIDSKKVIYEDIIDKGTMELKR